MVVAHLRAKQARWRLVSLVALLALTCAEVSASQIEDAKPVAGSVLKVIRQKLPGEFGGDTIEVVFDERRIYVDSDDTNLSIYGIYEDSAHSYALLEQSGAGGMMCGATYRVADLSKRPFVTETFGTCSSVKPTVRLKSGSLIVEMPGYGSSLETYIYQERKLVTEERQLEFQEIGSATAPDNDIADLVTDSYIYEAVRQKAVGNALRKLLGNPEWASMRDLIINSGREGMGSRFEAKGNFVVARTCALHMCTQVERAIAFDHFGKAWASKTSDSKTEYFGNPPPEIKEQLTPMSIH